MGLLDDIIGRALGGPGSSGALSGVIGSILTGSQGGSGNGLPSLIEQFNKAGLGSVIGSWIGTGNNQQVDPGALGQVFGHERVDQWAQQTGMSHEGVLDALSRALPHAVDHATPNGEIPETSPFDAPGLELR